MSTFPNPTSRGAHLPSGSEPLDTFTPVIRRVVFRTRDAARLAGFYRQVLGLVPVADIPDRRAVSLRHPDDGNVLLTLLEDPAATDAPPGAPGLFHLAFRFEELDAWRAAVIRTLEAQAHFHGASDHGVSWAVYLEDPDGNGLEFAWDTPSKEWGRRGDQVEMVTRALPLRSILRDAPVDRGHVGRFAIGHLHLQVRNLAEGAAYQRALDLRVTQSSYPGALFLARDDYHHHLGLNVWHARPGAVRPDNATGLVAWDAAGGESGIWLDPTGSQVTLLDV